MKSSMFGLNDKKPSFSQGGETSAADLEESTQIRNAGYIFKVRPLWIFDSINNWKGHTRGKP